MNLAIDVRIVGILALVVATLPLGCTPDDRCGDDFTYEDGVCIPVVVEDTETDSQEECAWDTAPDTRVGLGEVCDGSAGSCTGDADYCVIQPGAAEGYCTYLNCGGDPCDDCPTDYTCCVEFQFTGDNMCLKTADFEAMSAFCVGNI